MWKFLLLCVLLCFTLSYCKRTTPQKSFTTDSPGAAGTDSGDDDDPSAECNRKKRCPDKQAVCSNNYCVCKNGFNANANGKCVKVPSLGEICEDNSNNIVYCTGVGVSPVCPTSKKCECQKGYEPKGKLCVFKDQNLNEKCGGDEDCGVAFTSCQNGKCACIAGFTVEKGLCKSASKCSSGDALKDGANIKTCEKSFKFDDGGISGGASANAADTDSCPSTHYCFTNPLVRSATGGEVGYCCKKDTTSGTPVCPGGDAVKVDQCSSDVEVSDDTAPQSGNFCPALSHSCIDVGGTTLCCPLPCPGQPSFFAFEGRCYETLAPGSPCKFDLQCGRTASCDGSSKTCTCKPNFSLVEGVCETQ